MKARNGALAAILLILYSLASALSAEELRTIIAGFAPLSSESPEGVKLSIGYNDAVAVTIPKDSPFIQGFEIEIKSPQAALALPGALAWEIWRRVDPDPEKTRYGYSGDRILTQPLPARVGFIVQIPVRRDHSLKSGPYATLVPAIVEPKDFPFLFKLLPVTKGIPPELEDAQFLVRVRPLLTDEGGLKLLLRYPEGAERAPLVLSVDDKRIEGRALEGKDPILLKTGSHFLHIVSESYRDENRSIVIEQGRFLELAIDLRDTTPLVMVEAPDSALVLLDGVKINHESKSSFAVEPGEHTLSCKIGDYSLSRKFIAFRGKSYRVVLSVELQVQEGP